MTTWGAWGLQVGSSHSPSLIPSPLPWMLEPVISPFLAGSTPSFGMWALDRTPHPHSRHAPCTCLPIQTCELLTLVLQGMGTLTASSTLFRSALQLERVSGCVRPCPLSWVGRYQAKAFGGEDVHTPRVNAWDQGAFGGRTCCLLGLTMPCLPQGGSIIFMRHRCTLGFGQRR